MPDSISPEEAGTLLTEGKAVFLDVRRRADKEANPEMLSGAEWRDPEKVDAWKKEIPAHARVVLYCVRGGSVSRSVQAALCESGVNAVFIEGGLEAWKKTRLGQ